MAREVSEWAQRNDNVRAAVLTSSRANPRAQVDAMSDYDIELYVRDLGPFLDGDQWLAAFGEVLVKEPYRPGLTEVTISQWPDGSRRVEGNAGSMVIFRDGNRIDFTILLPKVIADDVAEHGGYYNDMGYAVLVDKDGLTEGAIPPTYAEYNTEKPTESEYSELVHHFWWDVIHVAKSLYRDQLFFAKYVLDGSLHHHYLRTALSWHVGMRNSWGSNPGAYGRGLKRWLDPDTWDDVEATFAGAALEDNWEAMFRTAEIIGRIARAVGEELGYTYPMQLGQDVTEYLGEVRGAAVA